MAAFLSVARVIFLSGPRIPIGLVVAAMLALYFYKDAMWILEARERVRTAVLELVSEGEIAALKAQLAVQKKHADDLRNLDQTKTILIDNLKDMLSEFSVRERENAVVRQNQEDEINEMLNARPLAKCGEVSCCGFPDGVWDRLRDYKAER